MNLAIQHLKQQIKETEVQLEQAQAAEKANRRALDESAALVANRAALLADMRALLAANPLKLSAVEGGKTKRHA
jgi:hypothetical protein